MHRNVGVYKRFGPKFQNHCFPSMEYHSTIVPYAGVRITIPLSWMASCEILLKPPDTPTMAWSEQLGVPKSRKQTYNLCLAHSLLLFVRVDLMWLMLFSPTSNLRLNSMCLLTLIRNCSLLEPFCSQISHRKSRVCQVQRSHLRLPLATRRGAATAGDLWSGTQRVDLQRLGGKDGRLYSATYRSDVLTSKATPEAAMVGDMMVEIVSSTVIFSTKLKWVQCDFLGGKISGTGRMRFAF